MTALPNSISVLLEDPSVIQVSGHQTLTELANNTSEKFDEAVLELKTVMAEMPCLFALSWGKDSTAVLLAGLKAHKELMDEGIYDCASPFIISNVNTGVENHLVQILEMSQSTALTQYCNKHSINLEYHSVSPPVAEQWSSLFLSGLKILSGPTANSDCSVILKVDQTAKLYRRMKVRYGKDMCTIVGSRLDESIKRKASMQRYGNDSRRAADIIDTDKTGRPVLAPIRNWSSNDVWFVINHAGSQPILNNTLNITFDSYTNSHRLIKLVYGDSESSSCPTSDLKLQGVGNAGGCGKSSRTGCFVCLKSKRDNSGEIQNTKTRNHFIAGNVNKVRDWLMSIAMDVKYRTWHTRAIDPLTGAIALMPNVLKAEYLDMGIQLLTQVSVDDEIRANRFRRLKALGREQEDPGYKSIFADDSLTGQDQQAFAQAYYQFADQQLINPMSLENATYLSAIHARDGIRLPPYRAMVIYFRTRELLLNVPSEMWSASQEEFDSYLSDRKSELKSNGYWIDYPSVDLEDMAVSEIPDARMLFPNHQQDFHLSHLSVELSDIETDRDCGSERSDNSTTLHKDIAKYWLTENELQSHDNDYSLRNIEHIEIGRKIKDTMSKNRKRHAFSKRSVKRKSNKNGVLKVLERGRTSVGSISFSQRSPSPSLLDAATAPMIMPMPTRLVLKRPIANVADKQHMQASYEIDLFQLEEWFSFGGAERMFEAHDAFVTLLQGKSMDIYQFQSTSTFHEMARNGLIKFSQQALDISVRILSRTDYFRALGIFNNEVSSLLKRAMEMSAYRHLKAKELLAIRNERNANRKALKRFLSVPSNDLRVHITSQVDDVVKAAKNAIERAAYELTIVRHVSNLSTGFDDVNYKLLERTQSGFLHYVDALMTKPENMAKLAFSNKTMRKILSDALLYDELTQAMKDHVVRLKEQVTRAISEAEQDVSNRNVPYWASFALSQAVETEAEMGDINKLFMHALHSGNSSMEVLSSLESLF